MTRPFITAVGLVAALSWPAAAQRVTDLTPRFYYLNVPVYSGEAPLTQRSFQDIQRIRAMWLPSWGPLDLDVAYEWLLTISTAGIAGEAGSPFATERSSSDFLPLQGTIAEGEHAIWTQRFDRLSLGLETDKWDVKVGRQTISYATTLFLTPADPFVPFDPADPFRVYRAGVDAVRARVFPGTFSTLEGVVRLAGRNSDTTVTALGRGLFDISGVELSAYAGLVYDDPSAAVGATFTKVGAAFRGEVQVRRTGDSTVVRLAIGVDRNWNVVDRSLYVVLEYQRDGLGAGDSQELVAVIVGPYFQRGELQVLGRNVAALSGQYQLHPLWSLNLLTLFNFNDPSMLLSPAAGYSVSGSVSLQGGLFFGFGQEVGFQTLGSEYGNTPFTAYVSLEAFF